MTTLVSSPAHESPRLPDWGEDGSVGLADDEDQLAHDDQDQDDGDHHEHLLRHALRETTSWSEGAPATSTMLGGVDRISTSRMGPDVSAWPIDVFHPSSSHMGACQDLESQAGRGHQTHKMAPSARGRKPDGGCPVGGRRGLWRPVRS